MKVRSGTRRKKIALELERDEEAIQKCWTGGDVYDAYIRPLLAEFAGTLIFVLLGMLSYVPTFAATLSSSPALMIYPAIVHGLALVFLFVAFGSISGCHLNPIVTLATTITGTMKIWLAILYVIFQVIGGIFGAGIARGVMPATAYVATLGATPALVGSVLRGVFMEGLLSFILVLVFLMASLEKSPLTAMAYGFAMFVGVLVGYSSTGGALNPVRALGPAVWFSIDNTTQWEGHWIYWVGPILGAALAAIFYRFILAGPEHRAWIKRKNTED